MSIGFSNMREIGDLDKQGFTGMMERVQERIGKEVREMSPENPFKDVDHQGEPGSEATVVGLEVLIWGPRPIEFRISIN